MFSKKKPKKRSICFFGLQSEHTALLKNDYLKKILAKSRCQMSMFLPIKHGQKADRTVMSVSTHLAEEEAEDTLLFLQSVSPTSE